MLSTRCSVLDARCKEFRVGNLEFRMENGKLKIDRSACFDGLGIENGKFDCELRIDDFGLYFD